MPPPDTSAIFKTRAELRALVLSEPRPAPRRVVIDGETFMVLIPTLAERKIILDMGGVSGDENGKATGDTAKLAAAALVNLVVDAGGEKLFEATDFEALQKLPVNSVADRLAQEALKVMMPATKGKDAPGNG